MAEERVQDYTDDKSEGHIDTREKNFECEDKDENLGCDPGIDVAGQLKGRCDMIGTTLTIITLAYLINKKCTASADCKV